jgi:hypothetical protein
MFWGAHRMRRVCSSVCPITNQSNTAARPGVVLPWVWSGFLQVRDEGRDMQRPDIGKLVQTPAFAPVGEAAGGAEVSVPRVIVIDICCEELKEAFRGRAAEREQGA